MGLAEKLSVVVMQELDEDKKKTVDIVMRRF